MTELERKSKFSQYSKMKERSEMAKAADLAAERGARSARTQAARVMSKKKWPGYVSAAAITAGLIWYWPNIKKSLSDTYNGTVTMRNEHGVPDYSAEIGVRHMRNNSAKYGA